MKDAFIVFAIGIMVGIGISIAFSMVENPSSPESKDIVLRGSKQLSKRPVLHYTSGVTHLTMDGELISEVTLDLPEEWSVITDTASLKGWRSGDGVCDTIHIGFVHEF